MMNGLYKTNKNSDLQEKGNPKQCLGKVENVTSLFPVANYIIIDCVVRFKRKNANLLK